MPFGAFGQQIARGLAALYEMVGRYGMHHVFSAPLRHMAIGATARARMIPGGHCPIENRRMASSARRIVIPRRLRAARHVVRIVTGGAVERTLTRNEAFRAAQPVDGVHKFEFVIARRAWGVVEEEPVSTQRLAGPVGERAFLVPRQ